MNKKDPRLTSNREQQYFKLLLLLDLYFPSAVLLGEILLILLHFRLLDLDRLDFTSLEGFLHALLRELCRALYIDGLELAVLIKRISSDLGQDF